MNDSVQTTEHTEDRVASLEDKSDKLTVEELGNEGADSGSKHWDMDIDFRSPVYLSDTSPRFPQELIELICECLWDEPVQLAVSCKRVCPAWYHAARRVLSAPWISWQTQEALQDHAHTLISHRNAPYRTQLTHLSIYDDARKPFAHVWPMFVPGWMLPELSVVGLSGLDWSTKTPHDSFFIHLSAYTSVSQLSISGCRFRSLTNLRRVINALPNLTSLNLSNVTLQHPLRRDSVPKHITLRTRSHKLVDISLSGLAKHSDLSSDYAGATALDYPDLLHMIAANSSTVTKLTLDLRFFASLPSLRRLLAHFCSLSTFTATSQFALSPIPTVQKTPPACTENASIHSLSSFTLMDVPDRSASQLLQLLATPLPCHKLEILDINLVDRPSSALLACASHVLQLSGRTLRKLSWCISVAPDLEVVPTLAGNTSLRELAVDLRDVPLSPQTIHSALTAVLSDITSMDLQYLRIRFTAPYLELPPSHVTPFTIRDTAESISTFHTILSRETFKGLPLFTLSTGVSIEVKNIQDNPTAVATIKAYVVTLFTPWLDRGIVLLWFGSEYVSKDSFLFPQLSSLETHRAVVEARRSKKTTNL